MLEKLFGEILGGALAPFTGAVSAVRRARMFHPRGHTLRAKVVAADHDGRWRDVASALAGPALVRLSSAWWKRWQLPDVLGCAVRFTRDPIRAVSEPEPGAQDLLFATVRRPWTTPFAPLSTDVRDYFANDYYAVSPFRLPDGARVEWRLTPVSRAKRGRNRVERLTVEVASGEAGFLLEARLYPGVFRRGGAFDPVALVVLEELLDVDQERLRFDPFRAGRGIQPVGAVHAMRRATYAASQGLRPKQMAHPDEPHEVPPHRPAVESAQR